MFASVGVRSPHLGRAHLVRAQTRGGGLSMTAQGARKPHRAPSITPYCLKNPSILCHNPLNAVSKIPRYCVINPHMPTLLKGTANTVQHPRRRQNDNCRTPNPSSERLQRITTIFAIHSTCSFSTTRLPVIHQEVDFIKHYASALDHFCELIFGSKDLQPRLTRQQLIKTAQQRTTSGKHKTASNRTIFKCLYHPPVACHHLTLWHRVGHFSDQRYRMLLALSTPFLPAAAETPRPATSACSRRTFEADTHIFSNPAAALLR